MKRTPIFSILIGTLLFASCETIVEIEIPGQETKLVFNGYAVPGDTLNIFRLSRSRGVLEPVYQFEPVTDGEIVLYENDIAVDTLHYEVIFSQGDYPARIIFHSGNTYSVKASGGELPSVSAFTTIPIAITPLITFYTRVSHVDNNGNEIGELKFTIPDPAFEENYYQLRLHAIDSGFQMPFIFFNSNDPVLNENASSGFPGEPEFVSQASFDDNLFNGEERSFTINMMSADLSPTLDLVVELISLDRSAYLYDRSLQRQQSAEGNPFAEPAPVFNNIENGYGIFGSLVVARDTTF